MLYYVLLVLHVMIAAFLVVIVLVQSGRGGGLAGAFGGAGATQTMFGGRGAGDVLTRTTQILGASFMATSLCLVLLGGGGRRSGISEESQRIIDEIREEAIRSQAVEQPAAGFGTELPQGLTLPPGEAGAPATTPGDAPPPSGAPSTDDSPAGAGEGGS
jgi:preprotein translocase subunit SecG